MRSNHRHQEFFWWWILAVQNAVSTQRFLRPSPRCTTKIEILTGCRHGNCLPCLASGEVSHWCPRRCLHSSRLLSQVVRWVAWQKAPSTEVCCVCCVWNLVLSEKRYCWYLWGDFFGWFGRNISTFISKGFHPTKWMDLSFEKDPEMDHLYYDHQ